MALTSGQSEIGFASEQFGRSAVLPVLIAGDATARPRVMVDAQEGAAHAARLLVLREKAGRCLWLELELGREAVPAAG